MTRNTYPTAAITGHRPFSLSRQQHSFLSSGLPYIVDTLKQWYGTRALISGMALGTDMMWAELAVSRGLDLCAYVPFRGQEAKWRVGDQEKYGRLLGAAREVKVFGDSFSNRLYHVRNEAMLNDCDLMVAAWCPSRTSGGTAATVRKAERSGNPLLVLDLESFSVRWVQR